MAPRRPAGAPLDKGSVVTTTDQQLAGRRLLLIVALQAERLVARLEHLFIHRAVWIMAGCAVVAEGFVLEDVRPALGLMALQTRIVRTGQFRATADDGVTLVRVMAVRTGHLAHGMRMRQRKLAALIQVTLEASARILGRVDYIIDAAARFGVDAAGTVTGFATDVLGRLPCGNELCMRGVMESVGDGFVTLGAVFRTNEIRPRDTGWRDDGTIHHHT